MRDQCTAPGGRLKPPVLSGAPTHPAYGALQRGPQVLLMERWIFAALIMGAASAVAQAPTRVAIQPSNSPLRQYLGNRVTRN